MSKLKNRLIVETSGTERYVRSASSRQGKKRLIAGNQGFVLVMVLIVGMLLITLAFGASLASVSTNEKTTTSVTQQEATYLARAVAQDIGSRLGKEVNANQSTMAIKLYADAASTDYKLYYGSKAVNLEEGDTVSDLPAGWFLGSTWYDLDGRSHVKPWTGGLSNPCGIFTINNYAFGFGRYKILPVAQYTGGVFKILEVKVQVEIIILLNDKKTAYEAAPDKVAFLMQPENSIPIAVSSVSYMRDATLTLDEARDFLQQLLSNHPLIITNGELYADSMYHAVFDPPSNQPGVYLYYKNKYNSTGNNDYMIFDAYIGVGNIMASGDIYFKPYNVSVDPEAFMVTVNSGDYIVRASFATEFNEINGQQVKKWKEKYGTSQKVGEILINMWLPNLIPADGMRIVGLYTSSDFSESSRITVNTDYSTTTDLRVYVKLEYIDGYGENTISIDVGSDGKVNPTFQAQYDNLNGENLKHWKETFGNITFYAACDGLTSMIQTNSPTKVVEGWYIGGAKVTETTAWPTTNVTITPHYENSYITLHEGEATFTGDDNEYELKDYYDGTKTFLEFLDNDVKPDLTFPIGATFDGWYTTESCVESTKITSYTEWPSVLETPIYPKLLFTTVVINAMQGTFTGANNSFRVLDYNTQTLLEFLNSVVAPMIIVPSGKVIAGYYTDSSLAATSRVTASTSWPASGSTTIYIKYVSGSASVDSLGEITLNTSLSETREMMANILTGDNTISTDNIVADGIIKMQSINVGTVNQRRHAFVKGELTLVSDVNIYGGNYQFIGDKRINNEGVVSYGYNITANVAILCLADFANRTTKGDVTVGGNSVVNGNIWAAGDVIIDSATVNGDIFAFGNIYIQNNAKVNGQVQSYSDNVYIGKANGSGDKSYVSGTIYGEEVYFRNLTTDTSNGAYKQGENGIYAGTGIHFDNCNGVGFGAAGKTIRAGVSTSAGSGAVMTSGFIEINCAVAIKCSELMTATLKLNGSIEGGNNNLNLYINNIDYFNIWNGSSFTSNTYTINGTINFTDSSINPSIVKTIINGNVYCSSYVEFKYVSPNNSAIHCEGGAKINGTLSVGSLPQHAPDLDTTNYYKMYNASIGRFICSATSSLTIDSASIGQLQGGAILKLLNVDMNKSGGTRIIKEGSEPPEEMWGFETAAEYNTYLNNAGFVNTGNSTGKLIIGNECNIKGDMYCRSLIVQSGAATYNTSTAYITSGGSALFMSGMKNIALSVRGPNVISASQVIVQDGAYCGTIQLTATGSQTIEGDTLQGDKDFASSVELNATITGTVRVEGDLTLSKDICTSYNSSNFTQNRYVNGVLQEKFFGLYVKGDLHITESITIGDSQDPAYAALTTIQVGGNLIIDEGVSLTIYGNLKLLNPNAYSLTLKNAVIKGGIELLTANNAGDVQGYNNNANLTLMNCSVEGIINAYNTVTAVDCTRLGTIYSKVGSIDIKVSNTAINTCVKGNLQAASIVKVWKNTAVVGNISANNVGTYTNGYSASSSYRGDYVGFAMQGGLFVWNATNFNIDTNTVTTSVGTYATRFTSVQVVNGNLNINSPSIEVSGEVTVNHGSVISYAKIGGKLRIAEKDDQYQASNFIDRYSELRAGYAGEIYVMGNLTISSGVRIGASGKDNYVSANLQLLGGNTLNGNFKVNQLTTNNGIAGCTFNGHIYSAGSISLGTTSYGSHYVNGNVYTPSNITMYNVIVKSGVKVTCNGALNMQYCKGTNLDIYAKNSVTLNGGSGYRNIYCANTTTTYTTIVVSVTGVSTVSGSIGAKGGELYIGSFVTVNGNVTNNGKITIGNYCTLKANVARNGSTAPMTIGNNVKISGMIAASGNGDVTLGNYVTCDDIRIQGIGDTVIGSVCTVTKNITVGGDLIFDYGIKVGTATYTNGKVHVGGNCLALFRYYDKTRKIYTGLYVKGALKMVNVNPSTKYIHYEWHFVGEDNKNKTYIYVDGDSSIKNQLYSKSLSKTTYYNNGSYSLSSSDLYHNGYMSTMCVYNMMLETNILVVGGLYLNNAVINIPNNGNSISTDDGERFKFIYIRCYSAYSGGDLFLYNSRIGAGAKKGSSGDNQFNWNNWWGAVGNFDWDWGVRAVCAESDTYLYNSHITCNFYTRLNLRLDGSSSKVDVEDYGGSEEGYACIGSITNNTGNGNAVTNGEDDYRCSHTDLNSFRSQGANRKWAWGRLKYVASSPVSEVVNDGDGHFKQYYNSVYGGSTLSNYFYITSTVTSPASTSVGGDNNGGLGPLNAIDNRYLVGGNYYEVFNDIPSSNSLPLATVPIVLAISGTAPTYGTGNLVKDDRISSITKEETVGYMIPYSIKDPLTEDSYIGNEIPYDGSKAYTNNGYIRDDMQPIFKGYHREVLIQDSGTIPRRLFDDSNETYALSNGRTLSKGQIKQLDIGYDDGEFFTGNSSTSFDNYHQLVFDTTYGGLYPEGRDMHILMPQGSQNKYYAIRIRGEKTRIRIRGNGRVFLYLRNGNVIHNTGGGFFGWAGADYGQGEQFGFNENASWAGREFIIEHENGTQTTITQDTPQLFICYLGDESVYSEIKINNINVKAFFYVPFVENLYFNVSVGSKNRTFYGGIAANHIDFMEGSGNMNFYSMPCDLSDVWYGTRRSGFHTANPLVRPSDVDDNDNSTRWRFDGLS